MDLLSGMQRDFGRTRRDDYEESSYHRRGETKKGGGMACM